MENIVIALLPIGALLAVGWGLSNRDFPGQAFWPLLDRMLFVLLLPALLVETVFRTDMSAAAALPLTLAAVATLLGMTAALMALRRFIAADGPAFSSVIQGAVRINVYAGFAVAAALFGDRGVMLLSLVVAFAIPLDNLLSIAALNIYAQAAPVAWVTVCRRIALNPIILALSGAFLLRSAGAEPPDWVLASLRLLGSATLPLALMAAGAGIRFTAARASWRPLCVAVLANQVLMPLLAFALCQAIGLDGPERAIVILYAALPTGPAGYAFARQMGGDAPLMAVIITVTTLVAIFGIPFWLSALARW